MRIAYLITAYDQPSHLQRLVAALDRPNASFHVHVDRRVDMAPFEAPLRGRLNVTFLRQRVNVNWMGYSQVESILALLRHAVGQGFDYCVLLSGSDYPIKTNDAIENFYLRAHCEYIAFFKLYDRPGWLHKVQYFYPIDQVSIHGYSKNQEPVYWRRLFWGRFHKYQRLMPKRRFPEGMVPYGGSDWWSISRGCAEYVLRFVDSHPNFEHFYRYTHCPSEMFFHTIILNSSWADRVHRIDAYRRWSSETPAAIKQEESALLSEEQFNFRYVDWSGVTTRERELPAVLEERDIEALRESDSLFARKFIAGRSDRLLQLVDEMRR